MNRIISHLRIIGKDITEKGLFIAVANALWFVRRFIPRRVYNTIMKRKHIKVKEKIKAITGEVYNLQLPQHPATLHIFQQDPIWFCWLQGLSSMPPIVEMCFRSIKANSNGHPIVVISLANYEEYISLPLHIVKLYNEGKICHAHFADILRSSLLYYYGGCWIDSTIFLTRVLSDKIFKAEFFSVKLPVDKFFISQARWSNFFLACKPGNKLMGYTLVMFDKYLLRKNYFMDYFMMDYFMDMVIEADVEIKSQVEGIAYNNVNIHKLKSHLDEEYSAEHFAEICGDTYIHKLNWRLVPQKFSHNTIYQYLSELYE